MIKVLNFSTKTAADSRRSSQRLIRNLRGVSSARDAKQKRNDIDHPSSPSPVPLLLFGIRAVTLQVPLLATSMTGHVGHGCLLSSDGGVRYTANLVQVDFSTAPSFGHLSCLFRLFFLLSLAFGPEFVGCLFTRCFDELVCIVIIFVAARI